MVDNHANAPIDLDALERNVREASGFHADRAMVLALVQRARESEATGAALVTAMARVREQDATITRCDRQMDVLIAENLDQRVENKRLLENLHGEQAESRHRIAQLERVRETAEAVLAADQSDPDDLWDIRNYHLDPRRADLERALREARK